MKKGLILLIAGLLLIAIVFLFTYPKFTGNTISFTGKTVLTVNYTCDDSDKGINYEVKGTVKQGEVVKGTDFCTDKTRLKEYYCLSSTTVNPKFYICPYKCEDGACVEESTEQIEESTEQVAEELEDTPTEQPEDINLEQSNPNFFQRTADWFKNLFN